MFSATRPKSRRGPPDLLPKAPPQAQLIRRIYPSYRAFPPPGYEPPHRRIVREPAGRFRRPSISPDSRPIDKTLSRPSPPRARTYRSRNLPRLASPTSRRTAAFGHDWRNLDGLNR